MSASCLTQIITYITTYVFALWRTLFAMPPSNNNEINLSAVRRQVKPLLPRHATLRIPPPAPLTCRIRHVSDGYMIYGVSDIKRINSGSVWEVQWGWQYYSCQEVRAMCGKLPIVHHIEDAIIWQSDESPIEAAIGFWVRQWRNDQAEMESTTSSATIVIGDPIGSVADSGIEMEVIGDAQEMV